MKLKYIESINLTREELYNLVWTEPMLALSKKYDISDVGLRKLEIRTEKSESEKAANSTAKKSSPGQIKWIDF